MSKNKRIPELRFPEFKNKGEWEEKKISELGETINGLTGKSGEDFGIGKPYVTYKQVFDNSIIDFKKCGKVQIGENENQNTLQKGDVLFTTSSETPNEVGFASVLVDSPKEDIYLNSFCFALRPFNMDKTQPQFSRYLFHSSVYRKSVTAIAQGSTRYNLSKGAFLELQVSVPNPKEQQRISSCLSSLDEVIAAHSHKLELLKDHKKGLMQNLFPREGEKVPKLRFKEFAKEGGWKLPKLEEKMDIFRGASPRPQGDPRYYGGSIPRLMIEDVTRDGKYSTPKIDSLTKEGAAKSRFLKKGSVVLSCSGTRVAIPGILKVDACIHDGWLGFKNFKEVDSEFLYYHFCNLHDRIQANALAGGVFNNLTTTILKELRLAFPTFKEQQKIASCLSSLDELITAQADKIEQLKLHKKGLMQGLFPKTIMN